MGFYVGFVEKYGLSNIYLYIGNWPLQNVSAVSKCQSIYQMKNEISLLFKEKHQFIFVWNIEFNEHNF